MQTAAFGFMLYSVFSISEDLIQFPFHGARLGKFQRIGLTDMVGGDAVTLCKAQNVADGNAVDDLGGRKPMHSWHPKRQSSTSSTKKPKRNCSS